ncbi:MAG: hypothetical protein FWG89_09625 [Treponema sp.]|nr:hypothetical protein [Treponema sp.]
MTITAPVLKDRAVLCGWIAGVTVFAILLWSLTFNFRAAHLMRSTNRVLAAMEDGRVLSAPLSRPAAGHISLGGWYHLAGTNAFFAVFTIMHNGILVTCGAEISAEGKVVEVIPLGNLARSVMDRIPQGLIQVYVRRIETSAEKQMRER